MRRVVLATMLTCGCATDDSADGDDGAASGGDDAGGVAAGPELDDEFDAALEGWEITNPDLAQVRVESGALVIEPTAMSLWFQASAGVLVSKRIAGDFVVTSHVRVRSLSDPEAPPAPPFRLGGIMARDPGGDAEDYVFIVLGADDADVSVETKSTDDSQSMYEGPPWPSGEADLRICRDGDRFVLSIRESASMQWQQRAAFVRPDLPAALQVGPMAYANVDPADVQVTFDAVQFEAQSGSCPQ